jgi:hypothetical protein
MANTLTKDFAMPEARAKIAAAIEELKAEFGERCSTGPSTCANHSRGEAFPATGSVDAVIWPRSTDEVQTLMGQYVVPVIPYGADTSLEGHGPCVSRLHIRREPRSAR